MLLCCRDLWCCFYVICCYAAHDGVGGHVNVPCTSYVICCYAAEIFGVVATLYVATLLMMGWGGGAC